ncbi:MAG: M20/M25/M40 family metallo-hydrolase [Chitinophagales bacterium]|nr:M20/M25/M40 family metallo-hydrolase [Chitinophagales bacterium]
MIQFISNVIEKYGGRPAGSEQEKGAQEFTADTLRGFCDQVKIEEFKSPLSSHFESLKIFSIIYWFTLWLMTTLYSQKILLGVLISGVGAILFIWHFLTYRHVLDFLFPKEKSWNVEGKIEPTGEVKSTLIIAGHIDSVYEFQWWYHFKTFGMALNVIAGFGFVLLPIYLGLLWIYSYFALPKGIAMWPYYVFVAISPAALSMFFMHGEEPVDGAIDNLTGVAMAVEMGKYFSQEKLKHTRLKLVSFGSEEPALRGAFAYVAEHKEELLKEKAVLINIDTIKEKANLTIATKEINTLVTFPENLVQKLETAFQQSNVPVKKGPLPIGASDASAFAINGLPSAFILGMDSNKYDHSYHTRLDNLEHLNPDGLEALKTVMIRFIDNWDKEQTNS